MKSSIRGRKIRVWNGLFISRLHHGSVSSSRNTSRQEERMGWWILRDWHSVSHLIKSQLSPLANHLDTSKQIQMCIHTSQPPIKPFTFEGVVVIQPLLLLSSTPPLLRRLLSKEGDKLYLEKFLGTVKSVVAEHFKLDNFVERDMTGAFIAYGVFQEDL
jgi:hypothetical protein